MNILVIGKPYETLIELIRQSKLLDKLFIATDEQVEDIPNIKFYSLENLAEKARALQVDIAFNTDKNLIQEGLVDIFKENRLNLISVNKKWLNLETSKLAAKQLMNFYEINNPKLIKAPTEFPVVLKTDSGNVLEFVYSMDELIKKVEGLDGQKKYIEEFLEGEYFDLYCLWDGKSLACFNSPTPTNEVKEDRLYLLKTKLSFMFSDEKADFTGLFKVKLIWAKNDWYVREFIMGIDSEDDIKSSLEKTNKDFLYILDSAIYQKLNELG